MNHPHSSHTHAAPRGWRWLFWLSGLSATIWLILRSGANPKRLTYPCQQASLAASLGFWAYLGSVLGLAALFHRLKMRAMTIPPSLVVLTLGFSVMVGGSITAPAPAAVSLSLPAWTSPTAVSDVFVVSGVPAPPCSLEGGQLPSSGSCSSSAYAFKDDGVNTLIDQMASNGLYLHKTAAHTTGIVGTNDVVVIKINNQWAADGDGSGHGRLTTNTDILKGVIWQILQHPDGFSGEVVVAENTQGAKSPHFNITPANAQDQRQSFQDVVNAFRSRGYNVSLKDWTVFYTNLSAGGTLSEPGPGGYPSGEFANGDDSDNYITLDDPAGSGIGEISYPKFTTTGGNHVSMKYGIWNGSAYEDRLTFLNLPVLKRHGMAGATIAWKNLVGFGSNTDDGGTRYADGGVHDYFWGYEGSTNKDFGLIAREMYYVIKPDLNIVDAIWVAVDNNTYGSAVRQNMVMASQDPFAVDWYASEYILRPSINGQPAEVSAAAAGTFRSATRVNQKTASALWGAGSFFDFLTACDTADSACDAEKQEMNIYLTDISPEAPVPTSPSGAIYIGKPILAWNTVGGATQYSVALHSDGSGTDILTKTVKSSACPNGSCHIHLSRQLNPGAYSFRVVAYDQRGWGNYSDAMVFTVTLPPAPVLSAPAVTLYTRRPSFQWSAVDVATKYRLVVYRDSDGKPAFQRTITTKVCSAGLCSTVPSASLKPGSYHFQVRSYAPSGWGADSSSMTFSVSLPPIPNPTAPSGTVAGPTPTFQWDEVSVAGRYMLRVYRAGSNRVLYTKTVTSTACSGGVCSLISTRGLTPGGYTFTLKSYAASGWSAFSSPFSFDVSAP